MLNHTSELTARMLQSCTCRMLKAHGLAYLQILMQYTNCYLDCLQLQIMINPPEQIESKLDEAELSALEHVEISGENPSLPIRLTDMKTVYAIQKRFAELREQEKLYRTYHDEACLNDVLTEIDQLNAYLEETMGTHGIKTFVDAQRAKAYNTIKREIKYFLGNIKKRDETLYWQLKAHLHIGLKCIWVDD